MNTNPYGEGSPQGYAYALGTAHGRNAASWYDIPDDSKDIKRVLDGINDIDPLIVDSLPAPDLSGQWAGDMTGPDLVEEAMPSPEYDDDDRGIMFDEVCTAYELGFSDAVEHDISARCTRALLGG